jgi:YbbR domain-containing protein
VLQRIIEWTATDWALKLTALALAFLLWTTVRAEAPGQWEDDVPVRIVNNDADWILAEQPEPQNVRVVLRGPYRELLRAFAGAGERPELVMPVDQVDDSTEIRNIYPHWVRMPPGTPNTRVVGDVSPNTVRLVWDRVTTRLIPVTAEVVGEPAEGFHLAGPVEIEPHVVRASGANRNLVRIDSLRLPPIDMRDRRSQDTLIMSIDTTGTGIIISPRTVRVIIPIRPAQNDQQLPPIETGRMQ